MYVIYDIEKTAIYGTGATIDGAWKQVMDLCDRPVNGLTGEPVSDDEWFARFKVMGATAALIAEVESEGGNIAWCYNTDGVACTVAEAEARWRIAAPMERGYC